MIFHRRRKDWYLIVGLGNPGREYRNNRHNVGFMCVDFLASQWELSLSKSQSRAIVTTAAVRGQDLVLAKPLTYMNRVGESVGSLTRFYKVLPARLLVVYDDLDLPVGELRMRPFGGTGGHRGMRSITKSLATSDFPRMRIGIGRPPGRMDPADYVLQDFNHEEQTLIDIALRKASDCVERFLSEGIEAAMTYCNTEPG